MGVVLPHVNTREEAEAAAGAAKFAPLGYRGMFGGRQSFGVPDYVHKANDQTMVVVLIEEVTALDNLDDILKVDDIDVFFVAPTDLSQTMGHIGNVGHPEVQAAIDDAIARIVDAGRTAGTLVNDDNVASYVDKGARFLMTSWNAWGSAWSVGIPGAHSLTQRKWGRFRACPEISALPVGSGLFPCRWRWLRSAVRRRGRRPSPTGRRGTLRDSRPAC